MKPAPSSPTSSSATARLRAEPKGADTQLVVEVQGKSGQLLAQLIYFDFGANPLAFDMRGVLGKDVLTIDSLHLKQDKLLDMNGSGRLNLAGETPSLSGDFKLAQVEFPAAFTAYVANFLATSMIGDANTRGSLSGESVDRGQRRHRPAREAPGPRLQREQGEPAAQGHGRRNLLVAGRRPRRADFHAQLDLGRRLRIVRRRLEHRVHRLWRQFRAHPARQTTDLRWRACHRKFRHGQSWRGRHGSVLQG